MLLSGRWRGFGYQVRLEGSQQTRSATVFLLVLVFMAVLLFPVSASAVLPEIEVQHMSEIEEWVYRNGAVSSPVSCAEVCTGLWSSEHSPMPRTIRVQELWDELGGLETGGTGLWGPLSKFREELFRVWLGALPLRVGWRIAQSSPGPDKWMELVGPTAPTVENPECPSGSLHYSTRLREAGEHIGSTFFEETPVSPGNEWYLLSCEINDNVRHLVKERANPEGSGCGELGPLPVFYGWKKQEWWWNECYEGFYQGHEARSKTYAEAYYQPFHFARPEDYTGQHLEGEQTANVETARASDPGVAAVKSATEQTLEISYALRTWIQWVLEGKHGPNPLAISPEEEYGPGSNAAPNKPTCLTGKPVNCATGNETETQTDLSVGGRGPGLRVTRTYNAQLAATQSAPGPFGYGWTSSYSARVELGEEGQVATVYQDDGSTARFLRSGEQWAAASSLVQAKLAAAEGGGYLYTMPDQTVLRFDSAGRLSSEADRNGNALTVARNGEGRLESVTDPAGRKLGFAYNSEGLIESVKDPMGHTVKYAYEGGGLASVTLPGEESPRWRFKYDTSHRLTKMTDGRGGITTNEYDSSSRVISQTDPLERTLSFEYAPSETKITKKATGAVTRETFSASNEPLSVTRGYGTAVATTEEYGYDAAGDRTSATDGNKHTTKFGYDAEGNRTSVLDAAEHETKWAYDSTHDVISMTTPKGETTTIKRDSHGNPEVIERPAPESKTQITKYKYASHGELESVTDPLERVWKYEYDSMGDRTGETDPEGNKHTWGYNEDSQEVSMVSPRGNVMGGEPVVFTTTIERDAQGRPLTVVEPPREPAYNSAFGSSGTGNGQFQFPTLEALTSSGSLWVSDSSPDRLQKFNEKGEYVAQFGSKGTEAGQFKFPFGIAINPSSGNMYVSDYENYRVQEFSSSGTFIRMFGYGVSNGKSEFEICTEKCQAGLKGSGNSGQFGNPDGVAIDSSGNVWVADETNNRLEEYAENGTFVKQFGTKGAEAGQIKQPVGLAYDHGNLYVAEAGNQRVQEFTTAGVYVTKFGSEGAGNGQFKVPYAIAAGPSTNDLYVTDRENNRVEVFTSAGVFLSSFGSKGKGSYQMELPTGVVANASETLYVSDHGNRRVDNWTGLTSRTTKYTYDATGNIETRTDPNGNKTKYTYNADNEQTKTEAANGTITETEYDGAGQIVAQTDANKHTTKYERNKLEEVTEVIDPLARKTTKEYDPAGNLTAVTDPAKRTTTYTYDAANRLTEVKYSDGKTPTVKYEYDKDNNRTSMTDGTGTTTYTYDQLDRLTEAKDGHGDITKYEYDLANQQTGITYPNGKTVTHTYDKDGRLEKITDWLSDTTKFAYNPDSDLTSTAFPSASTNEDIYAYNNSDHMSEVKMLKGTETLASLIYARDANSQVIATIGKGLPGSEITETTYDANNRLTKNASTVYEYDPANDPTKIGTGTYKYDNASELETGPSTTYTYNELGERTKTKPTTGQTTTYSYDQAGNLTTVERPKEGEKAEIKDTYAYDGEGLRSSQTISGTTTYLVWDKTEGLPLILSDETNSYIYGPDGLPVEQVSSGGTVTYLHHDQQSSTRLLTGSTGTTTATTTFDAYGNKTGSTGTSTTPLGYDAQYTSSDTGLIYMRARVYDPATAQFLSVDPLADMTRLPYAYAVDNPLNLNDPTGLIFGIPGTPSWSQVGTRFIGFWDGFTRPLAGGTAALRGALGLNGGLETCSIEYKEASNIGGLDASIEAGAALGGGSEVLLDRALGGLSRLGPVISPLAAGVLGGAAQHAVAGESITPATAGQGVVGGLAGELATGLVPGTSAAGAAGAVNAALGLLW